MRKFTKYPSNYVKASTDTNRYMKDLSEYLDYLSDAEIADIKIEHIDDGYEPECWIEIPEHLRNTVENAVGSDLCSPNESYWYQIEYHPDDDSIFFGINTDMNVETLKVSKETEDRFKQKFRESLGIDASTSIKADTKVYKISDNPSMYTNIDFDNMYAELDKEYAKYPNAKGYIDGSIKLHLDYGFITRAEANALRTKYLGDN